MYESRKRVAVSPSPREVGTGWALDAVFADGEQTAITGFGTESEAHEWLGSARHVAWLRDVRTAFSIPAVVPVFADLGSYVAALADVAFGFFASARRRWDTAAAARRRAVYRGLFAATGALLVLVTVIWILAAVLVTLGRSEQPARLNSATTQVVADRPVAHPQPIEVTVASDPIALLIDRVGSSEAAPEPAIKAADDVPPPPARLAGEIQAATPQHEPARAAPGIVGVWVPEGGSCPARNAREDVLPAIISQHGARAGAAACVFKKQTQTESGWRILANCTDGRERWTSNVRLAVKGDRLVWASKRGTQAYTRCRSTAMRI
jgi:hypothetical protein